MQTEWSNKHKYTFHNYQQINYLFVHISIDNTTATLDFAACHQRTNSRFCIRTDKPLSRTSAGLRSDSISESAAGCHRTFQMKTFVTSYRKKYYRGPVSHITR